MRTKHILQIVISILMVSMFNNVIAQSISWSSQIGSSSWDWGRGITDKAGNFFIFGNFQGVWCYLNNDTLVNNGQNSLFLAKYDSTGAEIWAQRLGGDNSSYGADLQGGLIFYDSITDYIFIAGHFGGTAQFGSFQLTAKASDIFLAKYDQDGTCIWAKSYGGIGYDDCAGITFDKSGNIYMCGVTNNIAYFDSISVQPGGFLTKLDQDGNCIWAKQEINYEPYFYSKLRPMDIKVVSDTNILIDGCTEDDNGVQIDTITINHPGFNSSMICCFDGNGNIKWVREGISNNTQMISQIGLDSVENIYFTGNFVDSINFSNHKLYSTTGNSDMFLVKYDKNGIYQWARKADAYMANGNTVVSDPQGYTYVTGSFSGLAGFDGFNISSYSNKDMFLARYSQDGNCIGVLHFGNCQGWGVTQDKAGNPNVVIEFMDTISIGKKIFVSHGLEDILITKWSPIISSVGIKVQRNKQLFIYANPSNGICNIILPDELLHEGTLEMRIYNESGKLVKFSTLNLSSEKIVLNLSELARGIYQISVGKDEKFFTGKIIFN
ncbi:MAG: T9SS type A sorting domain-containing protein [Bacteroidota bacterium]|nr:T9SS type A sorting domain-containing protein [Bacteroidota bacterium]